MRTFRDVYVGNTVETASPAEKLIILVNHMVLCIQLAIEAQMQNDPETVHLKLVNAQDIVNHLDVSLDRRSWDGAEQMSDIYRWLSGHLMKANMSKDTTVMAECLRVASDVADVWREAAAVAAAETGTVAVSS